MVSSIVDSVVQIFTDGGSRGNPGPAAIGCVIEHGSGPTAHGALIWEYGEYIGETTNNQAEYRALVCALEKALELGHQRVQCYLDSELLVKQLNREYRVKDAGLQQLYLKAYNRTQKFESIRFEHIRRELNKHADRMVNEALDARGSTGLIMGLTNS